MEIFHSYASLPEGRPVHFALGLEKSQPSLPPTEGTAGWDA